jgi:hypothetical protein
MKREGIMRILKLAALAALAMALVAAGWANAHAGVDDAGTTAASFLTQGSDARILAMGGATLGLGRDVGASNWNAAALGWIDRTEVVLSHAGFDNGSIQEWAAFGGRYGESQTRWMISGLYQGEGSFEGRDASNNPTGSFSVSSFAIGTHLAQQVAKRFTVGLGAKWVHEGLADVSGSGFTFDGGILYRNGIYGVGVAAQNLGGQMRYDGAVYRFPANIGVGFGVTHARTGLHGALDVNIPSSYDPNVRGGLEWQWKDMMALRAGYRQELGDAEDALSGPTFGLGAGANGFWLDYGYLLSSQGEGQHRMALRFHPAAWGGTEDPDPFRQTETPRSFKSSEPPMIGPPAPKSTGTSSSPKKKR